MAAMPDAIELFPDEIEIVPGRKMEATVAGLYVAPFDHFETRAVAELDLSFEGIDGDFHRGHTRRSGGREPWYPRGTEMRNERQLSIVAPDELALVAEAMGLPNSNRSGSGPISCLPECHFCPCCLEGRSSSSPAA
jgi:hypothetical protein